MPDGDGRCSVSRNHTDDVLKQLYNSLYTLLNQRQGFETILDRQKQSKKAEDFSFIAASHSLSTGIPSEYGSAQWHFMLDEMQWKAADMHEEHEKKRRMMQNLTFSLMHQRKSSAHRSLCAELSKQVMVFLNLQRSAGPGAAPRSRKRPRSKISNHTAEHMEVMQWAEICTTSWQHFVMETAKVNGVHPEVSDENDSTYDGSQSASGMKRNGSRISDSAESSEWEESCSSKEEAVELENTILPHTIFLQLEATRQRALPLGYDSPVSSPSKTKMLNAFSVVDPKLEKLAKAKNEVQKLAFNGGPKFEVQDNTLLKQEEEMQRILQLTTMFSLLDAFINTTNRIIAFLAKLKHRKEYENNLTLIHIHFLLKSQLNVFLLAPGTPGFKAEVTISKLLAYHQELFPERAPRRAGVLRHLILTSEDRVNAWETIFAFLQIPATLIVISKEEDFDLGRLSSAAASTSPIVYLVLFKDFAKKLSMFIRSAFEVCVCDISKQAVSSPHVTVALRSVHQLRLEHSTITLLSQAAFEKGLKPEWETLCRFAFGSALQHFTNITLSQSFAAVADQTSTEGLLVREWLKESARKVSRDEEGDTDEDDDKQRYFNSIVSKVLAGFVVKFRDSQPQARKSQARQTIVKQVVPVKLHRNKEEILIKLLEKLSVGRFSSVKEELTAVPVSNLRGKKQASAFSVHGAKFNFDSFAAFKIKLEAEQSLGHSKQLKVRKLLKSFPGHKPSSMARPVLRKLDVDREYSSMFNILKETTPQSHRERLALDTHGCRLLVQDILKAVFSVQHQTEHPGRGSPVMLSLLLNPPEASLLTVCDSKKDLARFSQSTNVEAIKTVKKLYLDQEREDHMPWSIEVYDNLREQTESATVIAKLLCSDQHAEVLQCRAKADQSYLRRCLDYLIEEVFPRLASEFEHRSCSNRTLLIVDDLASIQPLLDDDFSFMLYALITDIRELSQFRAQEKERVGILDVHLFHQLLSQASTCSYTAMILEETCGLVSAIVFPREATFVRFGTENILKFMGDCFRTKHVGLACSHCCLFAIYFGLEGVQDPSDVQRLLQRYKLTPDDQSLVKLAFATDVTPDEVFSKLVRTSYLKEVRWNLQRHKRVLQRGHVQPVLASSDVGKLFNLPLERISLKEEEGWNLEPGKLSGYYRTMAPLISIDPGLLRPSSATPGAAVLALQPRLLEASQQFTENDPTTTVGGRRGYRIRMYNKTPQRLTGHMEQNLPGSTGLSIRTETGRWMPYSSLARLEQHWKQFAKSRMEQLSQALQLHVPLSTLSLMDGSSGTKRSSQESGAVASRDQKRMRLSDSDVDASVSKKQNVPRALLDPRVGTVRMVDFPRSSLVRALSLSESQSKIEARAKKIAEVKPTKLIKRVVQHQLKERLKTRQIITNRNQLARSQP